MIGFDRDLGLAGRAIVKSQTQLEERLFTVPGAGKGFGSVVRPRNTLT